ncbi:exopolysaccharide biosynthesis protein [Yoonia algicola]|uniref:Exopolysaccharide biosynthesis protein n=1 Tax=Yoonia algicola TaxID=3137368 RepID=A0AAN0M8F0_9RHOB
MSQPDTPHRAAGRSDAPQGIANLSDIINHVIDVAKGDFVSVRDVIRSIGNASFAPMLLLPAVAVATPLSGIPFFSSIMGIVIFLVSIQMLLNRRHLWLPAWLLRRTVKGHIVRDAFAYLRPSARWIDARMNRRIQILVHRPFVFIPQLLCTVSGAMMPLMEFVPFSSSVLGVGVALLALGMVTRDGIVVLIGLLPYALIGWLITNTAA